MKSSCSVTKSIKSMKSTCKDVSSPRIPVISAFKESIVTVGGGGGGISGTGKVDSVETTG